MGGACSKRRPKYKQKVRAIYDGKGAIKDLVQYAKANPRTWPDIGRYLLKQLREAVEKQQRPKVEVQMECFNKMLYGNEADLEAYLDHVINAIFLMFDNAPGGGHDFFYLTLGMKLLSTLMPLSHRQLKPAKTDRFFSELIKASKYPHTKRLLLATLRKLITHTDDRRIAGHLSAVIPLILKNMDPDANNGSGEASELHDQKTQTSEIRATERDEGDRHATGASGASQHSLSERCWEAICDKVKDLMRLRELLRAFFDYARKLGWEPQAFLLSLMRTIKQNACNASVGLGSGTLVQETLNEMRNEECTDARIAILRLAGELGTSIQAKEPNCELETLLRTARQTLAECEECPEELAAAGRDCIVKMCNRLQTRDGLSALQEITVALRPGGPPVWRPGARPLGEPPLAVKQALLEAAADVAAARARIDPQELPDLRGTVADILRNVLQCQQKQMLLRQDIVKLCQQVIANLLLSAAPGFSRRRRWDHAPIQKRVAEKINYFSRCLEDDFQRLQARNVETSSQSEEEGPVVANMLQAQQRRWLYATLFLDLTKYDDRVETIRMYWLNLVISLLSGGLAEDLPLLFSWCMQLQQEASALQRFKDAGKVEHGAVLHTFALSLVTVAVRLMPPTNVTKTCLLELEDIRAQRHADGEHSSRVLIVEGTGLLNVCILDDDTAPAVPMATLIEERTLLALLEGEVQGVFRKASMRLVVDDEKQEVAEHGTVRLEPYDPENDIEALMADGQDNASSVTTQNFTKSGSMYPPRSRGSSVRHQTPEPLDIETDEEDVLRARDFDGLAAAAYRQCRESDVAADVLKRSVRDLLKSLEFASPAAGERLLDVPGRLDARATRSLEDIISRITAGEEDEREMLLEGCATLNEILQTDSDMPIDEEKEEPSRDESKKRSVKLRIVGGLKDAKRVLGKKMQEIGQKMTRHRSSTSHDNRRDDVAGIELVERAPERPPERGSVL